MSVPWSTYFPLSLVMFFEYAVWGAWYPMLAARLLGPLKMNAKQTSWIYITFPVACLIAPLVAGQLADKWLNAEWILFGAHVLGAILMFMVARTTNFTKLVFLVFAYSLCYAATLPLVNAVLFTAVKDDFTRGWVFIWAPLGWALVGYSLSGWRALRKAEGDGSDALWFCGLLGLVMAGCCLALPAMVPANTGEMPILKTLSMLRDPGFLVFIVASLAVAGMLQFYFLGTGRFLTDRGIPGKAVPGVMAIAQATQTVATLFCLGAVLGGLGFQWTLTLGAGCWLLLYAIYLAPSPRWLLIAAQSLHGFAYVLFMIVGQIYAEKVAPEDIRSSMQALIFAATFGVGVLIGNPLAGFTMDKFSAGGKFQWAKIWVVPLAVMVAGVLVFALVFQGK